LSTPWHADASEIGRFVRALFAYAESDTYLSLRAFDQFDRAIPPRFIRGVRVNGHIEDIIREATVAAEDTAQYDQAAVFCPPIATFAGAWKADTDSLANGLTLSVELDDADPDTARARLEGILGPVTVVVRSGSEWTDATTGEIKPKVHLHWRLSEPTTTREDHFRLNDARAIAALLTGADPTAAPPVHPLRWPGSWNLKTTPRMATISVLNETAEINLDDALEALELAAEGIGNARRDAMPGARGDTQAKLSDIRSAMAAIPNPDDAADDSLHYRFWVRYGIAIYRATGGSPEGFEIFDNWSRLSDKYERRGPGETLKTWRAIANAVKNGTHHRPIGAGTIFLDAMKNGWVRPFPFGSTANGHDSNGFHDETNGTESGTTNGTADTLPPILTARQFLDTFTVPDYLIDGIIQRGRVYALTSPTGHGKTAVALLLGCMVATGRNIGNMEVEQGHVLFLAGENPDDLTARFHAACQTYGLIDPDHLPIHFMPGNFPVTPETAELLRRKIDATGNTYGLIIGDSVAAYFSGENENDNVQMGACARNWRILSKCRGTPAVIALSHPVKNPDRENLLPRGGGAFIAEIDVNLTLWAEGERETTSLHWAGKIRGADFSPVNFALVPVKLIDKADKKGRPFMSVVATVQSEEQAQKVRETAISDENVVLDWLRRHPGITLRTIAENAGWVTIEGRAQSSKVHRLLKSLRTNKLVKNWRGKWVITDAGMHELNPSHKRETSHEA
jgi:hypothetical protein